MKKLVFIFVLLLVNKVSGQNLNLPRTNGPIHDMIQKGDTLIFGGDFTKIYLAENSNSNGVPTDSLGGIIGNWAVPNGAVVCAIPDGKKGVYIGGCFTYVGDSMRGRVAHLDSMGRVMGDLSGIVLNDTVYALLLLGDTLFISGGFDSISGTPRNKLAAVNLVNNSVLPWNPNPNGAVFNLCGDGQRVYATGSFTNIGQANRNLIAALNLSSGAATAWNPSPNGEINSMSVLNGKLFVGGHFTAIGGKPRMALAAINLADTGVATSWNPDVNSGGFIRSLAISGGNVYVLGDFISVGGSLRGKVAALDTGGVGNANAWSPSLGLSPSDLSLYRIAANENQVFIFGFKLNVGSSSSQLFLKSFSTAIGAQNIPFEVKGLNPRIFSIVPLQKGIYIAGFYGWIGGVDQQYLAAWNMSTNQFCDNWRPYYGVAVTKMLLHNDSLIVGGGGSNANFQHYPRIGIFNAHTGSLYVVNNYVTLVFGAVNALAIYNNTLFIGGQNLVNDVTWARINLGGLVKLNLKERRLETMPYCVNVSTLGMKGSHLYIGGRFETIGSVLRRNLGIIDVNTNDVLPWNPNPNAKVNTFVLRDSTLLAGGGFTSISGEFRTRLCEIKLSDGTLTNWAPVANDTVRYLEVIDSLVYVAGDYTSINGIQRRNVSRLTLNNGAVGVWQTMFDVAPDLTSGIAYISKIVKDENRLFLGGSRLIISGKDMRNLVDYNLDDNTTATRSYITIEKNWIESSLNGETILVGVNSNVNWAVVSAPNWLNATKILGGANGMVQLVVFPNIATASRFGYVELVSGGVHRRITVFQDGIKLALSTDTLQVPYGGDSVNIQISSNYNWQVSANQQWLHISNSAGTGNSLLPVKIIANDTTVIRTAVITITSGALRRFVFVRQTGAPPYLTVDKDSVMVQRAGDTIHVQVLSNTSWQSSSSQPWLVVDTFNVNGNAVQTVIVALNPSGLSRAGMITFTSGAISKYIYVFQDSLNTGLNTIAKPSFFKLYPNPAHTRLTIERTSTSDEEVEFYTPYGVLMFRQVLNEPQTHICTDLWPAGLYYMRSRSSATSRGLPVLIIHE